MDPEDATGNKETVVYIIRRRRSKRKGIRPFRALECGVQPPALEGYGESGWAPKVGGQASGWPGGGNAETAQAEIRLLVTDQRIVAGEVQEGKGLLDGGANDAQTEAGEDDSAPVATREDEAGALAGRSGGPHCGHSSGGMVGAAQGKGAILLTENAEDQQDALAPADKQGVVQLGLVEGNIGRVTQRGDGVKRPGGRGQGQHHQLTGQPFWRDTHIGKACSPGPWQSGQQMAQALLSPALLEQPVERVAQLAPGPLGHLKLGVVQTLHVSFAHVRGISEGYGGGDSGG